MCGHGADVCIAGTWDGGALMGRTVRKARRWAAAASAAFLVAVNALGAYCTAYAAVSITEAGEYFFRMMCSAAGVYFDHSEVGLVVDVLNQVALQSDKINSKEFQERMDYMLSLSPADRIEETFANAFLADLVNGFRESTVNADGHGGGGISFPVPSDIFVATEPFTWNLSGIDILVSGFDSPVVAYCFLDHPSGYERYNLYFVSQSKFKINNGFYVTDQTSNGYYVNGYGTYSYNPSFTLDEVMSLGAIRLYAEYDFNTFKSAFISSSGYVFPVEKLPEIPVERVWVDAYDDAALHVPAITAPITIPADVAEREENLKAVSAAEDKDALYKALGAAGIAIDIGTDIPDETEKPTTGETTDDGTVAIGKSLSDILAAITGLADKVAAIPKEIAGFFTPDTAVIAESFDSLKGALLLKFGGISQLADVFSREYSFGTEIPVIKVPIPDQGMMRTMFDGKTELVVLDLTPLAPYFPDVRNLLTAMLYVGFAFWFLDEFDVKIHIG